MTLVHRPSLRVFDRGFSIGKGLTSERQRRRSQPPLELHTAAAMEDSLNLRGAMELSKGKGKAICVAKGKKSMLDVDLEKTISEEEGRLKKDEEEEKEKWKRKREHEEQWVPSRRLYFDEIEDVKIIQDFLFGGSNENEKLLDKVTSIKIMGAP